jgi:hypothetical protein
MSKKGNAISFALDSADGWIESEPARSWSSQTAGPR